MATATSGVKKVLQNIPVVNLQLTEDEASALVAVLRRVGGMPDDTRRGLVGAILVALQSEGVSSGGSSDINGSIFFS